MDSLAEKFDVRCNIITNSGQAVIGTLDQERLEIEVEGQVEGIVFGQHMTRFKELYEQKSARLRGLWSQYEDIQRLIMELAVSICSDDEVLIGYSEQQDESEIENGPGIDEDRASDQREGFRKAYNHGLDQLEELKVHIDTLTSNTLKENNGICQVSSRFAICEHRFS